MTRESFRRRRLLGRRPVVHHAPDPAANVAADVPAEDPAQDTQEWLADVVVSRETAEPAAWSHPMAPYVAGGLVPSPARAPAVEEPVPALSSAQVARLEALTAQWAREVRVGGPGPDDTLLYPAAKMPPPPAPRSPVELAGSADQETRREAAREAAEAVRAARTGRHSAPLDQPATPAVEAPRRVSEWASRHDPRSLEYGVRSRLRTQAPLQDYLLPRGPVLDQGTTPPLTLRDASACTGMAAVAAANALDLVAGRPARLGVADARAAYALAQDRDHVSGNDYAGSSVLAVMKAGQELGWWDGYLWALGGTRDVAQALLQLRAPVVVGLPWPASMEDPDADGVVTPGGEAGGLGHALAVVGFRMSPLADRPGPWFVLQQSRGVDEGAGGLVYLHHAHLGQLLAGRGEAAVPIRGGQA